jgi:hypothetical protein
VTTLRDRRVSTLKPRSPREVLQDLLLRARATMTKEGTGYLLQAVTKCLEELDAQKEA